MIFLNRTKTVLGLNKLNDEAKAHNSKIEIVVMFGIDDLRFTLSEVLTAQEETDLDTFLAAFVDENPEDKIPKIIDLAKSEAKSKHFHNIIYTSNKELKSSLIPKRTVVKGEVTKVEWYRTLDANMAPTDLVLVSDITYTRDATGFAQFRSTNRTYINRDGTENIEVKNSQKYYFVNLSDMITEGYKRRKLLVESMQIPSMTFMMEVLMPLGYTQLAVVMLGRAFMDDYESDFNKFVDNSSTITDPSDPNVGMKSIVVQLQDNTVDGRNADYNLWLDKAPPSIGGQTTIRQYLISELSI